MGNPYFTLSPLKVEVAHGEPHRIIVIRNIITDKVRWFGFSECG